VRLQDDETKSAEMLTRFWVLAYKNASSLQLSIKCHSSDPITPRATTRKINTKAVVWISLFS